MLHSAASSETRLKNRKSLPKTLPGVVCVQWKRCGRARCRCARGALHGPYYYRYWREGGRLCKAYVKRGDVEAVRVACAKEREINRTRRMVQALARDDWRRLTALLRERENDG